MPHVFHDHLPGYDPGNVLHDGCPECERRSSAPLDGLTALDADRFRQLWADMIDEKWGYDCPGVDRRVSVCDQRMMSALYTIAVLLERAAGIEPRALLVIINREAEGA